MTVATALCNIFKQTLLLYLHKRDTMTSVKYGCLKIFVHNEQIFRLLLKISVYEDHLLEIR